MNMFRFSALYIITQEPQDIKQCWKMQGLLAFRNQPKHFDITFHDYANLDNENRFVVAERPLATLTRLNSKLFFNIQSLSNI